MKAASDERGLGDRFYQCDHHRPSAKTLAHPFTQRRDIGIVIHDLAAVHRNVPALVLRLQLGMTPLVNLALRRNLPTVQLPEVTAQRVGENPLDADLLFICCLLNATV